MTRNREDLFARLNMIIAIQEREVKNTGQSIAHDQRGVHDQLMDLLILARKLRMQAAVDWLQPQVIKMAPQA